MQKAIREPINECISQSLEGQDRVRTYLQRCPQSKLMDQNAVTSTDPNRLSTVEQQYEVGRPIIYKEGFHNKIIT